LDGPGRRGRTWIVRRNQAYDMIVIYGDAHSGQRTRLPGVERAAIG
jgi:hypothetical protein